MGLYDKVLKGVGSLTFNSAWGDLQEDIWIDYRIITAAKVNLFFTPENNSKQVLIFEPKTQNIHIISVYLSKARESVS